MSSKDKELPDDEELLKVDIIAGYIFNKIKKTFETSFGEVYQNLLLKISDDYGHDLDELREKYPFEVTVHKRKPKDPTLACLASKKNGDPCAFARKDGYDFCGVHLKSHQTDVLDNPISERGKVKKTLNLSKTEQKGSYIPKEGDPEVDFKPRRPTYEPKTEEELDNEEKRSSLNSSMQSDQEIEIEVEEIEDEKYLVRNRQIYFMPDDLENIGFRDLKLAGTRKDDGSIKWDNQRIKMKN